MCGICGFAGPPHHSDGDAVARAMAAALAHRGPDGEDAVAFSAGSRVAGAFGHRRLSVLDLSERAMQPMTGRDGRTLLTYNGELYGFRELRRELAARGHRFDSTGDTEVVLRAYEEWGPRCVERLDGMFAVAVWDAPRGMLVLARDRFGEKPLSYVIDGGRLTFASEVKGLARAPWVRLVPDRSQIAPCLVLGYVPPPATAYAGVRELPPATVAEFDPLTGRFQERCYWRLPTELVDEHPTATDVKDLRRVLEGAVRQRLVADVPVGVLLSGGVDSSVVASIAARESPVPLRTFSAGFPDAAFDERPIARETARRLGADHTEFTVEPDAAALLDRLVWLYDGPFADSSALPTYLVSAAAREAVTVVLTGDGGDEVFGGYQRFAAAALSRLLPPATAEHLHGALRRLPSGHGFHDPRRRAGRFLAAARLPLVDRYLSWVAVFDPELFAGDAAVSWHAAVERAAGLPPIDRLLHANARTYLPGDLLVKIDRASMAHGLEARAPLLDTVLAERVARIPARHKVGLWWPKPLLRRIARPILPVGTFRRPKRGFGVPVDAWFRGELGQRFADEVLAADGRAQEHLDRRLLEALLCEHRGDQPVHGARLWSVLVLERWLRSLEGPAPLGDPGGRATAVQG